MKPGASKRLVAVLATLLLGGCGVWPVIAADQIEGQMVEEGTSRPIAGAIVVALWYRRVFMFFDSETECANSDTATTDANGHYRLNNWRGQNPYLIYVYKPGYVIAALGWAGEPLEKIPGPVKLSPFSGTTDARLDALLQSTDRPRCKYEIDQDTLPALYKAMYEEGSNLARTIEEKRKALILLRSVETLEVGERKAWENWDKRNRGVR